MQQYRSFAFLISGVLLIGSAFAQQKENVTLVKEDNVNQVNVYIGEKLFTRFFYPDTLEKPVLYPVVAANGATVTRGFPLDPKPGEPTDHPHHIGIWFNFENVNGLDFWNNSFAIAPEKKKSYGWVRTTGNPQIKSGKTGTLTYQANWTNQQKETLLKENTTLQFSGTGHTRIIDRVTTLTADRDVTFTDAKDGMLAIRLAQELQIPTVADKKYTDDKGNVTIVKGVKDSISNGNYITSEGKSGDAAWSTRARWCKVFGRIGRDSVSVTVIDHPQNPNYPTFWHARGYGLFAANPLGEKIFTNGASAKNLQLKKGESVVFRFRMVIQDGPISIATRAINVLADEFASSK